MIFRSQSDFQGRDAWLVLEFVWGNLRCVKRNMVTFPEQKWRLVHHLQQWTLTAPRPPRIMEPQFSHQICSNLWLDQTNLTWDLSLSAMTMMIMMQLLDWFSFCRDFLSTGKNMMPIDHREPSPLSLCDQTLWSLFCPRPFSWWTIDLKYDQRFPKLNTLSWPSGTKSTLSDTAPPPGHSLSYLYGNGAFKCCKRDAF